MPLLDKFKRQCDVLESTEILLHILHETLRSSDREKDLEEFINQSFNVEHLYYIFTQNQDIFTDDFDDVDNSNIYINHQRILPQKLDVENADLKQLVISTINQKYPNMSGRVLTVLEFHAVFKYLQYVTIFCHQDELSLRVQICDGVEWVIMTCPFLFLFSFQTQKILGG